MTSAAASHPVSLEERDLARRILLDCRFLGLGGAGRATELLLRGLGQVRPAGEWILWGPESVGEFVWEGARHEPSGSPPTAIWGQRSLSRVPGHDLAVYMHQIRPLRPGPAITFIHDTVPLRYGGAAGNRLLKRLFYLAVARLSSRIVTVSEFSRARIERDLHIPPTKLHVVRYPVDEAFVARVQALRRRLASRDVALYVGRFMNHKNLENLIRAFARTAFCRRGGTLLLVGGNPEEVRRLSRFSRSQGARGVTIEPTCPQAQLEELYASSRFLVMPSREEGFGLPVWEAMSCGLPVCVSDGGALPEITAGLAHPFPAERVDAMAAAIDRTAAGADGTRPADWVASQPSIADFARQVVSVLPEVGAPRGSPRAA